MRIEFCKYTGTGNDFLLVDDRKESFPTHNTPLIAHICHRHYGVGADGVILLQPSSSSDFRMRIFNSDGKEAEMCGNGLRCFSKFLHRLGLTTSSFAVEVSGRQLSVHFQGDEVCVHMGNPLDTRWNLILPLTGQIVTAHYLDTGVPHVVIFVDDVEQVAVEKLGAEIRYHSQFSPRGTNVDFVQLCEGKNVKLRTYERGVEGETLACGTGATAAALATAKVKGVSGPIRVHVRSEEVLEIGFNFQKEHFQNVTMAGPATFVFQGTIEGQGKINDE